LLNTTKLIFTLFKISSIAISMVIIFRRVNNPYMPIKNKAVLTNSICDIGTPVIRKSLRRPLVLGGLFYFPVRLIEKFVVLIFESLPTPFLSREASMAPSWRSRYIPPSQLIKACSLLQKAMHNHRWLFLTFENRFLKRSN